MNCSYFATDYENPNQKLGLTIARGPNTHWPITMQFMSGDRSIDIHMSKEHLEDIAIACEQALLDMHVIEMADKAEELDRIGKRDYLEHG